MYKALIVDDERMIRNGVRQMIPWKKIGVDTVFTAENGLQALEVVTAENPDIMLTDICMSEMDGLALIEKVNVLAPHMRILVLTGYDNFEYVQKCCKMQVQDFILKPADEEELTRAIKSLVEQLDKARNAEQRQRVVRRAQGASAQLLLEQAMRALIHGRAKTEDFELLDEYDYNWNQQLQAAIIVPHPDAGQGWREHNDLLKLSVKNICFEVFDALCQGITFEDDAGHIVIAVFDGSSLDESFERMEKLCSLLQDEYEFSPKIVIGGTVNGFGEIGTSYDAACHLLTSGTFAHVVLSPPAEHRLRIFYETFNEIKRIITANTADMDVTLRAYDAYCRSVQSYNLSTSLVRRCCFELASVLYFTFINDTGESVDNRLCSLLGSLLLCDREETCKLTLSFINQLFSGSEQGSHKIIDSAKQYIAENLAQELSVSSIAQTLYITPNYFSRLFKRIAGEGCNEYIVRKRIEKAKSLLESTDIKIGKIAGMIGYQDTNYFSLAFKKHTGHSPSAYRESLRFSGE